MGATDEEPSDDAAVPPGAGAPSGPHEGETTSRPGGAGAPRDEAEALAALAALEREISAEKKAATRAAADNTAATAAAADKTAATAVAAEPGPDAAARPEVAGPAAAPRTASAPGKAPAGKAAEARASGGKAATPAPAPHPYIVEFDKVTKSYGDFTAIRDVTFKIEDVPNRGEMVSILGPSGCGKSTVIRLIAGLAPQFPATRGTVLCAGEPIRGPGPDRGMVFQDYTSFDNRSVLDNVAFGLECRGVGRRERHDRARHWIQKVGLSVKSDADKLPHELSGGMRQRVAIARTLILEPRVILMDEPFGALDPPTRTRMQDNLVALWREQSPTVFFITHSVEEAVYLGDTIFIFSGSPGTILKEVRTPPPTKPSLEMQRDPEFRDMVFEIRALIEKLESSSRAGD
ncbi:MAG: ATP-binding cassette domain-containing protein [Myxococcales bacterium]|nr:ATP-binding cassette domain-containing protein [Myxococcales bacterium]